MRVLLTGFEPFDGGASNPSQRVVEALNETRIQDILVIGRVLPVVFATVPATIEALLDEIRPDAVISLGLASSDTVIRLEWFGSNKISSERPDNAGVAPQSQPIDLDGPAVRQSTIDMKNIAALLKAEKIPLRLSFNAGTHCCNLLLYSLLSAIEARALSIQAGFIHLPPESAMPIEQMTKAVSIAISSLDP
jgi:pyroglutamyl-peptidase